MHGPKANGAADGNIIDLLSARKLNGSGAPDEVAENDNAQVEAPAPVTKPIAVAPIFANFPAELTTLTTWFMWRYVQKPGKPKPDKVPFQPNGHYAKTNDSSTWHTFEACCAAYNDGGFDGIGLAFDGKVGDDGLCYTGGDFDRCTEGGKLVEPGAAALSGFRPTRKSR